MKAYLINPADRTVSEFKFSGKRPDMIAMLGTTEAELRGLSLNDDDTESPDVVFVAHRPTRLDYFMVSAIPIPLAGLAVVVGIERADIDGDMNGGHAQSPTMTLEWLKNHLIWLEKIDMPNGDVGFKCDDILNAPTTTLNVIAGLKEYADKHSDMVKIHRQYLN